MLKKMEEEEEIWKDIPGFENIYMVSSLGRVKSLPRMIFNGHRDFLSKEKIFKFRANRGGYLFVALYKNKQRFDYKIHQLVAMAFLDHKINGNVLVPNHINGIKTDNRACNLEVVSHRENCTTCFRKNKYKFSSIYPGVYWSKSAGKWISQIWDYKNVRHLGTFFSEEDAYSAYKIELSKIESKRNQQNG
jgi:hypothetical protein